MGERAGESSSARRGVASLGWWVRDRDGRLAVVQRPNPAIAVWLVTVGLGWTGALAAEPSRTVANVGRGALVVWAVDELVRGASPFRRGAGATVLAVQLVRLLA